MIKKLVVWGGNEGGLESHRWIHRAFYENARKIGIDASWVPNLPTSNESISDGATVIAADIWSEHLLPRPQVNYVIHNFNGDHPVCQETEPERLLRLQVWTHDAFGEQWAPCRQYDAEQRILFQPWGADLLAEEFMDPVFNPTARTAVFVGAIWSEVVGFVDRAEIVELGNQRNVDILRNVLREYGLSLHHLTQVTSTENINAVREARIAPAIAGGWQVEHGYLPCRIFKNASYGALAFTNVAEAEFLLGDLAGGSIEQLVATAMRLRRPEYERAVRDQQRQVSDYTYRQSLEAISRTFEEGE